AVAVVIEERAAGAPAPAVRAQPCRRGHVGEVSLAVVAIEAVLATGGDEAVVVAVVVVIADAGALAPSGRGDARLRGDVLERAIALVAIEVRGRLRPRRKSLQRRAVDEEQIEPSVVVVIDHRDAG